MNYPHTLLVTGTDTDIGKTRVALSLMAGLQSRGLRVAAMKPVASGCASTPVGLRNEDAQALLLQANVALSYAEVNPYAFAPPIAPHLAAAEKGETVSIDYIIEIYTALRQRADVLVVEGAGGWRVPLNADSGFADLAQAMDARIVLVVGMRLGCINHALLSAEAIQRDGLEIFGWVANHVDAGFDYQGSLHTLQASLAFPLLGVIPFTPQFDAGQASLHLAL